MHNAFVTANRTADVTFLEKYIADGADTLTWYNLNQSNYIGKAHIIQLWEMLKRVVVGGEALCEPRDDKVTIVGDIALVTYLLRFEADFGNLGAYKQEARATEVWQRIEGEWRMIHFHCSNYVPGVMGGK
ncbi:MAG: YybH family protein [Acidimicrobiales bacterium]